MINNFDELLQNKNFFHLFEQKLQEENEAKG